MKNTNQNHDFFQADEFLSNLISLIKMDKASPQIVSELLFELKLALIDRIYETVIDSFSDKELFLFNKLIEDHPAIDEFDALSLIVPSIEGLSDRIIDTVNSFQEEVLQNSLALDIANNDNE